MVQSPITKVVTVTTTIEYPSNIIRTLEYIKVPEKIVRVQPSTVVIHGPTTTVVLISTVQTNPSFSNSTGNAGKSNITEDQDQIVSFQIHHLIHFKITIKAAK